MTISFYMDHNVHGAITAAVRAAGIDVVTAQEDGFAEHPDTDILDRATALQRVLFTQDEDFLVIAARRQRTGVSFYSVIYAHQSHVPVGQCVRGLLFFANGASPGDLDSHLWRLPF